ncbi:reverse transcriptase domain-containing protein [Tanacetum coccineum]
MTELTLEESLSMFMTKIAKRLDENTNLIKELRASMDFALRNQKASIKALEIQPRVNDETISASVETDKPSICRIDASQYAVVRYKEFRELIQPFKDPEQVSQLDRKLLKTTVKDEPISASVETDKPSICRIDASQYSVSNWNGYLRKGRKTKPKRQNRTRNGKDCERQSQIEAEKSIKSKSQQKSQLVKDTSPERRNKLRAIPTPPLTCAFIFLRATVNNFLDTIRRPYLPYIPIFQTDHSSDEVPEVPKPLISILTWDDLVSKFINKFFPPSKTTNLRNEITRFQQKFDETFYEAWDRFNDLLRGCPHHGFSELHQLDTFYNALNSNDQDSLKLRLRGVSTSSSTPAVSSDVAELKDMVRALILDKKNQTPAPASVKAIEQSCVTCGGGHSYQNCPATNDYRDNIQEYVSQAAAVNYNQGNASYPTQMVATTKFDSRVSSYAKPSINKIGNQFQPKSGKTI